MTVAVTPAVWEERRRHLHGKVLESADRPRNVPGFHAAGLPIQCGRGPVRKAYEGVFAGITLKVKFAVPEVRQKAASGRSR